MAACRSHSCDQRRGCGGERGGGSTLGQACYTQQFGIACDDERHGGSGESDQSSEQYRARPDAVNERTEHRFENDFGTVVDRE